MGMSVNQPTDATQSTETAENNDDDGPTPVLEKNVTRRQFGVLVGAAAATAATAGTASAQEDSEGEDVLIDFSSEYAHDPWIPATITVEDVLESQGTLDFTDDDGDEDANLGDEGYVLAREPDDDETPHNPVTLSAAALHKLDDDGNREVHPEYGAFPRGSTYDDDADSETDEVDVSVLDATHWSTSGSITVADGSNGALDVSTSGVASGSTATATFDLSTVASDDETISSGVSRKFLQFLADVDSLPSGVLVEVAIVDSNDSEVVASIDPDGDVATTSDLLDSTGDSQVGEVRVGELETDQSVDLADIQQLQIRVSETDATLSFHGINLERESEWTFGTQEYQTTDDDGNTVVETQDVTQPAGEFSVLDLETLDSSPFSNSAIESVDYDVEATASELPNDSVMARVKETPDTYDYPFELETVYSFEGTTAYSLSVNFENMLDEVALPGSRYLGVGVSTGSSEFEDWGDVEDESWTSRTSDYDTPGEEVEMYSSVAASDVTHARHRYQLREGEKDDTTRSGAVGAVAVGGDGGGGIGNWGLTAILSFLAAGVAWFRKPIMSVLGR